MNQSHTHQHLELQRATADRLELQGHGLRRRPPCFDVVSTLGINVAGRDRRDLAKMDWRDPYMWEGP